ncbi:MAG: tetratricopeptide repeat protein [Deltaproteobacteria bacterium]|nr:tetratricopeptide repeat protein [Deltaproteobacteria bacterium]
MRGAEFRVEGRADGTGDAFDAQLLFDRAATAIATRHYDEAIADYDRLIEHFPTSPLIAAAHFNRGQCHQAASRPEQALQAYTSAVDSARGHNEALYRDALFRIAVVAESANRPPEVVRSTGQILQIARLSIIDRVEALAREAAAHLALGDRPAAQRAAEQAISLAPTPESVSAMGDDTFVGQARFVLAEISRTEASTIVVLVEDPSLELAIERRVQLVTHAHVLYNDAIRVGNPHFAAASGFAIGEMYQALYGSIVLAPLPCEWDPPAIRIYRDRTARRLRPLIQGALRAWEATLDMARRNAIQDNAWVRRTAEQIESLRRNVLMGPDPVTLERQPNCIAATTAVSPANANPARTPSSAPPR